MGYMVDDRPPRPAWVCGLDVRAALLAATGGAEVEEEEVATAIGVVAAVGVAAAGVPASSEPGGLRAHGDPIFSAAFTSTLTASRIKRLGRQRSENH